MKQKKQTAVLLALLLSLCSAPAAFAAETEQDEPQYIRYSIMAEHAPEELHGQYIPVLMYHHFAIRNMGRGNGNVTTVQELEEQLRYFKSQGYRIISLEDLDKLLSRAEQKKKWGDNTTAGLKLDGKYLCITMDDGYYSNYELGYPLFQKYRAPASVFAVTDYVTNQIGIRKFTWKQAEKMEKGGYMKVYSHTADHQPVEAGQEESFLDSAQRSEEALKTHLKEERVKAIAYPNGRYTEESQRLLTEDGYRLQFTVNEGVITNNTERDAIPRIMVFSGMDGAEIVRKIERVAENTFAAERGY